MILQLCQAKAGSQDVLHVVGFECSVQISTTRHSFGGQIYDQIYRPDDQRHLHLSRGIKAVIV